MNRRYILFFLVLFLGLAVFLTTPKIAEASYPCYDTTCWSCQNCRFNYTTGRGECYGDTCPTCKYCSDDTCKTSGNGTPCSGCGTSCSGPTYSGCEVQNSPACSYGGSCQCIGGSCTPYCTTSCGSSCGPNCRVTCPDCTNGIGCGTCVAPTATPTPTPRPGEPTPTTPPGTPTPTPTPGGIQCNYAEVSLSVSPNPSNVGQSVNFTISGDASTWIGDSWDPPASVTGCSGPWNNITCTANQSGSATWTHTWKKCIGDIFNCSPLCSESAPFTVTAPTPTPIPTPTPCPIPGLPTGLTPNCPSPGTAATFSWNVVAGATRYAIRIDDLSDGWDGSCSSPAGDFCDDNVSGTTYDFITTCGHSYNWWVHAINVCGWSQPTDGLDFTCQCPATCTVTLAPHTMSLTLGESSPLVANVTMSDGSSPDTEVDRINFSATTISGTDPVVTLIPSSNDFPPADYSIDVRADNIGMAEITGTVSLLNGNSCNNILDPTIATVVGPDEWYQTQGGDVHAQTGGVKSKIPQTCVNAGPPTCTPYFSLSGAGGYPGVVSYNGSLSSEPFGKGEVSEEGWLANSSFAQDYTYSYFHRKLGSPTSPVFACELSGCTTPPQNETTVYHSSSSVTISRKWSIPGDTTKVIVFIDGDLNITVPPNQTAIDVPKGNFLAFIVSGNINIDGNIGDKSATVGTPHLQGVYITDGVIDTYEPNPPPPPAEASGFRLVAAGIFYARGEFKLERNVKNDCSYPTLVCNARNPSELFIFRPDLVINAPKELKILNMSWQEVAP